jgi:hypothetical protein
MYLSRRIHPEIPSGDTGRIGIKAQIYSQPLTARLKAQWTGSTNTAFFLRLPQDKLFDWLRTSSKGNRDVMNVVFEEARKYVPTRQVSA